jgi:hypothetical protein
MKNNQVMLEALEAQLLVKQNEVSEYTKNVYSVKVQELEDSILSWFKKNVHQSILKATASRHEVTLKTNKDTWSNRLEFSIVEHWKKDPEFQFRWSSGNTNDSIDIEYGITIGGICSKIDTIKDLVMNTWIPSYKDAYDSLMELQEPVNSLNSSIYSLKQEIMEDQKASFMKPGFSLKLKSYKSIEWVDVAGDEDKSERALLDQPGSAKLQTGRSKYEYVYVTEFTVNKKVGYKYDVTISTETSDKTKTYQVTEKQFGEFIDKVIQWENVSADKNTERNIERFKQLTEQEA